MFNILKGIQEMNVFHKTQYGIAALMISLVLSTSCSKQSENNKDANDGAYNVQVLELNGANANASTVYYGTIEAEHEIPLTFSNIGTVDRVFVKDGEFVSKGQAIASINPTTYKHALDIANSTLKQAQDGYDRLRKVYKDGSLPEVKLVEIETKLEQAKSSVEISKKDLNDCVLKAPASGMLGGKKLEAGAQASPITPVASIYQIEEVLVKASIPENEISKIRKGSSAQVVIAALGNRSLTGKVTEIGVAADPVSHAYDIKIAINNRSKEIKPGMACKVFLSYDNNNNNILTIPASSVLSQLDKQYVYVLNSDSKTVKKQEIVLGDYIGNNIQVLSGLKASDKVVIAGQHKLFENAPIKIIK
jgi:RND family efflux transporter MFP subunit